MLSRLRAVLTPRILALALFMLLALSLFQSAGSGGGATALEERISRTLSMMEGAGKVEVVIATKAAGDKSSSGGLYSAQVEQVPCGAVAVAQGAHDPFVRVQIADALCALLGLPVSAVSVVAGGE